MAPSPKKCGESTGGGAGVQPAARNTSVLPLPHASSSLVIVGRQQAGVSSTTMDVARWLRFIVPGSIFEALLVGLVYCEDALFSRHPYGALPRLDGDAAAILAVAAVPIGYVLSTIMHQLKHPRFEWLIATMKDRDLLERIDSPLWRPGLSDIQVRSLLDADLHTTFGPTELQPVLNRARALLDLANGVATSFVAVALATIVVGVVGVVAWQGSDERAGDEIMFIGAYAIACVLAGVLLWFNTRRVTAICREFLLAAFEQHRSVANGDSNDVER